MRTSVVHKSNVPEGKVARTYYIPIEHAEKIEEYARKDHLRMNDIATIAIRNYIIKRETGDSFNMRLEQNIQRILNLLERKE